MSVVILGIFRQVLSSSHLLHSEVAVALIFAGDLAEEARLSSRSI